MGDQGSLRNSVFAYKYLSSHQTDQEAVLQQTIESLQKELRAKAKLVEDQERQKTQLREEYEKKIE